MAPPRKKSIRDELLRAGNHPERKAKPNEQSMVAKMEALALVQSGATLVEASEKTGLPYPTVHAFVTKQYYEDLVKTYEARLQACQERTMTLMEEGLKLLAAMQARMSSGTWLEEAEPDRINAMANLYRVTTDSTFRLVDSANRAREKFRDAPAGQGQLPAATAD